MVSVYLETFNVALVLIIDLFTNIVTKCSLYLLILPMTKKIPKMCTLNSMIGNNLHQFDHEGTQGGISKGGKAGKVYPAVPSSPPKPIPR